jgi:hypothetical protein
MTNLETNWRYPRACLYQVKSNAMIDHQIELEMILRDEVSDEVVEAAALVIVGGFPTLPHTYCFACPSDPAHSLRYRYSLR